VADEYHYGKVTIDLLKAAEERFPSLSEAERCMISAVDGNAAICSNSSSDFDAMNDPRNGANWGPPRTIDPEVIRWLCAQATTLGRSPNSPIDVYAAKISGVLDLSGAVIPCPLSFRRCAFVDEIWLKNAKVPSLILTGSWTRTILANGMEVAGNVLLNEGFHSKGQVLLRDAKIGGNLRTEDARFEYEKGDVAHSISENSLGCDRIRVNGSIWLSKPGHGSVFKGEVGLGSAFVGSNLECDDSKFENPGLFAIRADGITVVGSVFLRGKFSSKGAVRLLNAKMRVLDCTAGTFEGDGKIALIAEEATISGKAIFEEAVIKGGAALLRSVAAGDISFRAAELTSVDLRYATIHRALRLKNIVNPQHSRWDLRNASVDSLDDDGKSWPNPGNLRLDGFSYERFGSLDFQDDSATLRPDLKARLGWLRLDTSNPPRAYRNLASAYSKTGETLNSRETLFHLEDLLHRRRIKEARCAVMKVIAGAWGQCLKVTIGYGYRLWLSLCWLALLCAVGWTISCWGHSSNLIVPTDKDAYAYSLQHGDVPDYYPHFNALRFTIEQSLPAINLGISSSWSADGAPQNSERPRFATGIRAWFFVQRLFGWLLSIFFIVGITGLAKSDK
jgi:hypothetical protein